jgi:hypothetical protein
MKKLIQFELERVSAASNQPVPLVTQYFFDNNGDRYKAIYITYNGLCEFCGNTEYTFIRIND